MDYKEALRQIREGKQRNAHLGEMAEMSGESIAELESMIESVDDPVEKAKLQAVVQQYRLNQAMEQGHRALLDRVATIEEAVIGLMKRLDELEDRPDG